MNILALFQKAQKLPAGKFLFSKAVCAKAPYFGSISPLIQQLQPSYAEVFIKKSRAVENHFASVHAIAMCNMAELAAGLMTEVSIPKGAKWIPIGMTVRYVKKANTNLTAVADGLAINWSTSGEVVVPVIIKDTNGETVFTAQISMSLKQES